ncbi:DNA-dependent RNA polymerase subunit epsilon [Caenibacillus caldisaponilyticus]|jgi:DNA-dependent RNA polymerase auxiliary subunit epsilon|uniref:DNA-dependent RNA polymerase subunit epsilon n=1 Tax=Caenibacillus caldisaponilyticus TaxID=1674942 RepID=UPI0009885C4B|nr:DNA-directed RNA polymerase subunit epsilon [Caenibacillus caldisaponilyticus]
MIFKVLYQETKEEVPLRENTRTVYVEADDELEVRRKLYEREWNVEFIQPLEGAHLEYEKKSKNFEVEKL